MLTPEPGTGSLSPAHGRRTPAEFFASKDTPGPLWPL